MGENRTFRTNCPDVAESFLRHPKSCGFHMPALLRDQTRGAIAGILRAVDLSGGQVSSIDIGIPGVKVSARSHAGAGYI